MSPAPGAGARSSRRAVRLVVALLAVLALGFGLFPRLAYGVSGSPVGTVSDVQPTGEPTPAPAPVAQASGKGKGGT